ncbi:MAG: hypothetical protein WC742_03285 [Gallionellaceae bacterium]
MNNFSGRFILINRQRGAALMVMLVVLVLGSLAYLVNTLRDLQHKLARDTVTHQALAQAKQALIGYAMTSGDPDPAISNNYPGKVHGYLPCPDEGQNLDQDGEASSGCGSKDISRIGKLPWRTLGLEPLRDGNGECLWYAVSGTFKNNTRTTLLNDDTLGQFEVMAANGTNFIAGSTPENRAVAVIFSSGGALNDTQNHAASLSTPTCGGSNDEFNYLDNDTLHGINNAVVSGFASAVSRFIFGPVKNSDGEVIVNDQLMVITAKDIFEAIYRRQDFQDGARNPLLIMTKKTAECIASYMSNNKFAASSVLNPDDKRLPWAAAASPAIDTDTNYRDSTSTAKIMYGRLPNRVSNSRTATNNKVTPSPYNQMLYCSHAAWDIHFSWWSNWKDHVFYSVAKGYIPTTGSAPSCTSGCLSVNGAGQYAAVVMFSGKKLATQTRSSSTDKLDFSNYLEGGNLLSTIPITTSGVSNHQSSAVSATFNDVLYCIAPDSTVALCPL